MTQSYQATKVKDGGMIDHTPAAAVGAGDVVVQSNLVGIANRPIDANVGGSLEIQGIFDVVKANGELAAGTAIYWDADGNPQGGTAGSGAATATATGNTFLGWAIAAAGATDEVVRILKVQSPSVTIHYALSNEIADPGNAGAVPVAQGGHVAIVTAAAETRTPAAPTAAGQQILLAMKTDGDDCVIAVATGINQTGNNRIMMNDAGDTILLAAVPVGANLR